MIRLKRLLAENMRRFGTKNLIPLTESALSDDDIIDIIMTYTKDPKAAKTALDLYRTTGNFGDDTIEANVTRDPRWNSSDFDNELPHDIQFIRDEMDKLIKHINLKFINKQAEADKRIADIKFVVYDLLDPNTPGGSRPPKNFKFDNTWWNSVKTDIDQFSMQDYLEQMVSIAKYNGIMGE